MSFSGKEELARKIFSALDNRGSGFINKELLRKALLVCGRNVSDARLEEIYRTLDKNSDGKISVEEFIKVDLEVTDFEVADKLDSAKAFFELVDIDKDGFITIDEYTYIITAMGGNLTQIRESYDKADASKDGKISFSELVKYLKELNSDSDSEL
eukprot:TRINITY_DN410_c1_g1_i1.p1 TRINITY_DN410_c1_g1~~TRINITY_DN410_c1_g1_i1.p1  ORF type:complete len:155 (-),score=75.34 TRINITY_DN410_c1_g1_i1:120-584(-)